MFVELPSTSLTALAQWLPHVGKQIVVQCTTYHLDSRLRGNDKGTEEPCFAKASQGRLHSGVPVIALLGILLKNSRQFDNLN